MKTGNMQLNVISEFSSPEKTIDVFPNPAEEYITIKTNHPGEDQLLYVYNSIGEIIFQYNIPVQNLTINISEWENGFYFIRYRNEALKIIKTGNIK
jgi:hypothetical protein